LRGHDGGRSGPGQSARPSPELVTSYTTPGVRDDWWLACGSSSPHLPVCWTIKVFTSPRHECSSNKFNSESMWNETYKLVNYTYSKANAVKNLFCHLFIQNLYWILCQFNNVYRNSDWKFCLQNSLRCVPGHIIHKGKILIFIGPRCPWGPIYGSGCLKLSELPLWNLTDMTLADEDTNSILTDNSNRAIQGNVASDSTNASSAIWWPNLQPMQVAQSDGQICNQCKWRHLVAKFTTKASGAI